MVIKRTRGSTDWTADELNLEKIKIDHDVILRERYPHSIFAKIASKMKLGDSVYTEDYRVLNGLMISINKLGGSIATRTEGKGKRIWRIA